MLHFDRKQARKGFRPPSAMMGIGYFQNLRKILRIFLDSLGNFLGHFQEDFFGGIFWDIFWRNFLGEIFWEDFFWRTFLEDSFGEFLGGYFREDLLRGFFREDLLRGFLGGITQQKLTRNWMFLSKFWCNFVSMQGRRKEGEFLILRSATQAHRT